MKLSEMKQILTEGEITLTKSLGQNFLHDANQLRRIVASAALQKSDKVLEIGPGLGPLTEMLLAQANKVLAIEKDGRLVAVLRARFEAQPGTAADSEQRGALELVQADALHYLRAHDRDWGGWKLVANLPYSVASPLLVDLAQARRGPDRLVATLQIEVAKRLVAVPGGGDYGVLTLLMQLDYEPQGWFKIPASCFFPEPDVDSACVCLVRRQQALLPPELKSTFISLVKRGFSQRRKMMLKLLKQDWPAEKLENAFEQLHLSRLARAEVASLEQFVRLTQLLRANSEHE